MPDVPKPAPMPTTPPPPDAIMQFFGFSHLPPAMQEVSRPFCELACHVHAHLPRNAERTVALRKLLEAKDAAVRAAIAKVVLALVVAGSLLVGAPALAQAPAGVPNAEDPAALVKLIADAVAARNWLVALPLLFVLVIWAVRLYGAPLVPFLATDRGGALLSLGFTFAISLYAAAVKGGASAVQVIIAGFLLFATNQLTFIAVKKLLEPTKRTGPVPAPGPGVGAALALVLVASSLSGCAHGGAGAKAFASKTFDCAAPAVASQASQAVPAVLDALAGGTNGWADALDHLVLSFGDVAICAVKVAVAELSARPPAPVSATAAMLAVDRSELQLARAKRYLEANGVSP